MRHADDFAKRGIYADQIPDLVMTAVERGRIVGYQGKGMGRPIYDLTIFAAEIGLGWGAAAPSPALGLSSNGRMSLRSQWGAVRDLKFGGVVSRTTLPHGFSSTDEFAQFGHDIRIGLNRLGYHDAEPILQGSAVTGQSFRTGQLFDVGRVSDFDVALAEPSLLAKAQGAGIGLRSDGTRTGPLSARDLRLLGLRDLSNQLSQQAGRDVNFMIYSNAAVAMQQAPSIVLPAVRR